MASDILFVCTGNTCRSPVAEAVARMMFGASGLVFESAGLDARFGLGASPESLACSRALGAPLDGHCSRPVTAEILADTNWVIGMTRSHAAVFRSRFGDSYRGRIGLLGAPGMDLTRRVNSPDVPEVPDPYGGSQADYQAVCDQIMNLLAGWEPYFESPAARKEDRR